uniref:EF-hand domain-containing protein n=1 Tax=Ascaris lumbricoides TaxID=6252 RepID=A0A0M3IIR5_ASCLU
MNKDGRLTINECNALIETLQKYTPNELERFFNISDTDRNGFMRPNEFEALITSLLPSLFDEPKKAVNDDLEYFHQQMRSMTPQTEYDEEEDVENFEMVEHIPRPNDIPIRNEQDALRVLNMHTRNVSILNSADLDADQMANFTETLRLINKYIKIRNATNFLRFFLDGELIDGKLNARV